MIGNNFQRMGSISNSHVGSEFEDRVRLYFDRQGLKLDKKHKVLIGIDDLKKYHTFDLGSNNPMVIAECKSHKWTISDNTPSAKITLWNEAMYYLSLAPSDYRKLFIVLRDFNLMRNETLGDYYLRTCGHLIPKYVEIWEYDLTTENCNKIN